MSTVRNAYNAIFESSGGEATDLAFRSVRLMDTINRKLSDYERLPATQADVIFGRCAARLAELPIADLDATLSKMEKHVEKHGCSTQRCLNDDYRLSDLIVQMRGVKESLAPYLPHIPK